MEAERKIAIIDLGSNSVRLTIWTVTASGCYRIVDKARIMARLSSGMVDGMLSPESMDRTLEALYRIKLLMDAYETDEVFAVATAAVRMAANKDIFLQRAYERTGIRLQVLSGAEEARLDYLGVINTIAIDNCIIMDTGGASTELILVRNRKCEQIASLPIGAVVLTENYLNEYSQQNIDQLADSVRYELGKLPWLKEAEGFPVVGLGGSNRILSRMFIKLNQVKYAPLHNHYIQTDEAVAMIDRVMHLPLEEIKKVPGIEANRADIIVGGFMPLMMLLSTIQSPGVIASACGLREGLFFEHIAKDTTDGLVEDVLAASVTNLCQRFHLNLHHSRLVTHFSMQLYAVFKEAFGIPDGMERVLYASAMLHDMGRVLAYDDHEFHGFEMMKSVEMFGLSHREQLMVALLIGLHRGSRFEPDWADYRPLIEKTDQAMLYRLAAFLRLSEQLDRGQTGQISRLDIRMQDRNIYLSIHSRSDAAMILETVEKDVEFWKKAADVDVHVSQVKG